MISASEMNPQDARLLAAEHSAIADAARIYDFNLSMGTWAIAQAVCPEAPRHLILQFRDPQADGAESIFTAVVPRAGGSVRIIPVLHHGTPTRWNFGQDAQQRAFVDRVIGTGPVGGASDTNGDWTSLASCYAALVGDRLASRGSVVAHLNPRGGISGLSFSAFDTDNARRSWTIHFNQHREITLFDSATPQETMRPVHDGPPLGQRTVPAGSAPASRPVS